MTDRLDDQLPEVPADVPERVSLRGRGWQIMRGEAPLEAYSAASDLPDLAPPAEAAPVLDWVAAPELSKIQGTPEMAVEDYAAIAPVAEEVSGEFEAIPPIEVGVSAAVEIMQDYVPRRMVQELVPADPEELPDAEISDGKEAPGTSLRVVAASSVTMDSVVIRPQDTRLDAGRLTMPGVKRSDTGRDIVPDDELLDKFVTDDRLERVWRDIETLQEELADRVDNDPVLMDAYQQELLQASTLLLADRANYDDVRAILYRVQLELAHKEKVQGAIKRYKPQLLFTLFLVFILWIFLMAVEPFVNYFMTQVLDITTLGMLYHAALFGMLGALVFAYFTLNKHTIQQQDFDPQHISWYLMNPLIGLIMGILVALIFGVGVVSTVGFTTIQQPDVVLNQYPFLLWLVCFLVGYNQNAVLRLLNRTFSLLRGRDNHESGDQEAV